MVSNRKYYSSVMDPRSQGCCSVNLVKGIFVFFNLIYLVSGILILLAGVWTYYTQYWYLMVMKTITYKLITWILVATGGLVIIGSFIGCVAVRLENRCLVTLYMFMLVVVFICEAFFSMLAFVYHDQVNFDLHNNLKSVFQQTYSVNADQTQAIDLIQQELFCCGALSFEDWNESIWYVTKSRKNRVPDSCCKTMHSQCGISNHPSNIPYTGCAHPIESIFKYNLLIIAVIGVGVCFIQVVGFFYSTCLLSKLVSLDKLIKAEWQSTLRKKKPVHPFYSNDDQIEKNNSSNSKSTNYIPVYTNGNDSHDSQNKNLLE